VHSNNFTNKIAPYPLIFFYTTIFRSLNYSVDIHFLVALINELINMTTTRPNLDQLPESFVTSLANHKAIALTGEEQTKYLQGQVTCDVDTLNETGLLVGSHCDAKGKVLSVFRLIKRDHALLLIQPQATVDTSLSELKKFGVFAKVDIEQSSLDILGCYGEQSAAAIKAHFGVLPDELSPTLHVNTATLVYLAGTNSRYLIIDEANKIDSYKTSLEQPEINNRVWTLLDIVEGFPLLSEKAIQHYVPQMLNVDAIGGISFTKGCYLGQETVARMQYLGKNKKAMALFKGHIESPFEDATLEKQLGENWRSAGDLLASYISDDGTCYMQLVIANDLEKDTVFRFKHQPASNASMLSLPYSTQ